MNVGFQHTQGQGDHLVAGHPRIDPGHLERLVEPVDVLLEFEGLVGESASGLCHGVAQHHG